MNLRIFVSDILLSSLWCFYFVISKQFKCYYNGVTFRCDCVQYYNTPIGNINLGNIKKI